MMRKDEKTKMRDFWSVHRGEEGEEEQKRWRRGSREKGRVSVGSASIVLDMLPPPAETSPFLRGR